MPRRPRPEAPRRRGPQPHEVLGLPSCEDDAVKVIEAAQLLLRRWRRVPLAGSAEREGRAEEAAIQIRRIIAARESMLERIHARCRGCQGR